MPFRGGTESQDLPTVRKLRRPGRLPAVGKNFRLAQDSSSKGNFERLDTIGPARVATRLEAEGTALPKMLGVLLAASAATFYRHDGTEFLGIDGAYHPVPGE